MSKPKQESDGKPIIDQEFVGSVAALLEIEEPAETARLAKRMQRYSDRLYFARRRAGNTPNPGDARKDAKSIVDLADRLSREINAIALSDEFGRAYREERRATFKPERPSLERLTAEIKALRHVCQRIVDAPPFPSGRKGDPILKHVVGAFMALFEDLADARPRYAASTEGVKGDYLVGRGGLALRDVFKKIAPKTEEKTLARYVSQFEKEYGNSQMREGDFDFVSGIEDAGEFEFVALRP